MKLFFSLLFMAFFFFTPLAALSSHSTCYKNLQQNFFQEELVYQSLSIYRIPQGLWGPIAKELKSKSIQVPIRMQQATARLVPNPLQDPMRAMFTAQLLIKVLKNLFYETMTQYQVNERPTADFVFDYILIGQMAKLVDCFGEEAQKLIPSFE